MVAGLSLLLSYDRTAEELDLDERLAELERLAAHR